MAKIDYGSNQGRAYDDYLPEPQIIQGSRVFFENCFTQRWVEGKGFVDCRLEDIAALTSSECHTKTDLSMRNNPAAAMPLGLAHDPRSNWPLASGDHEILSPLPGRLTLDEWLQRRMPSDNMGFALALAIVGGIMIGVLLAHAWARM